MIVTEMKAVVHWSEKAVEFVSPSHIGHGLLLRESLEMHFRPDIYMQLGTVKR